MRTGKQRQSRFACASAFWTQPHENEQPRSTRLVLLLTSQGSLRPNSSTANWPDRKLESQRAQHLRLGKSEIFAQAAKFRKLSARFPADQPGKTSRRTLRPVASLE